MAATRVHHVVKPRAKSRLTARWHKPHAKVAEMDNVRVAHHAVTATAVHATVRVATAQATVVDTHVHSNHAKVQANPVKTDMSAPTAAHAMTTMTVTNVNPAPMHIWAACASVSPG